MNSEMIGIMRCPVTGETLHQLGDTLVNQSGTQSYRLTDSGIPLFAEKFCSIEGRIQQSHYDRVAAAYLENLTYPHTKTYLAYLDDAFLCQLDGVELDRVAEICCGRGEAFHLLRERVRVGVGIDVSISMLEAARQELVGDRYTFVQADANRLPLADSSFDSVIMFGGIHHVNDRAQLFTEISRILKPGGRFYWREPVSDFFLWRWLRGIIYRFSPALDHQTERPLLYKETVPFLESAGFRLRTWKTYGFIGFCFFMNSDVLVFNRFFRYIPGVNLITKFFTILDDMIVRMPCFKLAGLQVIGVAEKQK